MISRLPRNLKHAFWRLLEWLAGFLNFFRRTPLTSSLDGRPVGSIPAGGFFALHAKLPPYMQSNECESDFKLQDPLTHSVITNVNLEAKLRVWNGQQLNRNCFSAQKNIPKHMKILRFCNVSTVCRRVVTAFRREGTDFYGGYRLLHVTGI